MNRLIKINQLQQLISALFREIIREPGVLFWGILFPILMSLGLGLAFTKKADVTRKVAVVINPDLSNAEIKHFKISEFLDNNCERNISAEKE